MTPLDKKKFAVALLHDADKLTEEEKRVIRENQELLTPEQKIKYTNVLA
jgi:hypothetical protein